MEVFMVSWNKQRVNIFTFTIFILLCLSLHVQACETKRDNYKVLKDVNGRRIVLQRSLKDKALQIFIGQSAPKIISLPGQSCYEFILEETPEGDLVVLWYAVDPNKEGYSIYITTHSVGKNEWTEPLRLSAEDEQITADSVKLILTGSDDITVFWESLEFFTSSSDQNTLGYRHILRNVNGSVNSWGHPSTHSLLNESGN